MSIPNDGAPGRLTAPSAPSPTWFRTPRVRRGLAASVIALSAGGLVLLRAPLGDPNVAAAPGVIQTDRNLKNFVTFSGPGAHGTVALSHGSVLAGGERRLFAEVTLTADRGADEARERAPLSLAVVLDTSGSMAGDKLARAKDAAIALVEQMRDDDEIAFVRYASDAELLQPLARVGSVRRGLISRIRGITAGGGTNIPPALAEGLRALDVGGALATERALDGARRVRRIVLASDGLDSTRAQAEALARDSAERGITISSMGIGLDFDESYMGGVARAGHGNFAFVSDASALASFLARELKEAADTTVENATARVRLPGGVRFVRAIGAEARPIGGTGERGGPAGDGGEIELRMGSLFAGDERRIVLELAADLGAGEVRAIDGQVGWDQVGGESVRAPFAGLQLAGTDDARVVEAGRDGSVYAGASSALASLTQIEAAEAYARGDGDKALQQIDQNLQDLERAKLAAPAPAAAAIERQQAEYRTTRDSFVNAAPTSADGKRAAKASAAKDLANASRSAF